MIDVALVTVAVRTVLGAIEPMALRVAPRLAIPPIFIVGVPRVGSTLASILATRHLRAAFPSNMLMATPASPVLTAMLLAWRRPFAGSDDLQSRLGETSAPSAPSQGYRFWNLHIPPNGAALSVTEPARRRIRDTVFALQGLAGGPFINKWQANSLRVSLLDAIFPGCIFVRITRADIATAESILCARRGHPNGELAWLSIRPSTLSDVSAMNVHAQIAAQIAHTNAVLSRDLGKLDPARVLSFDYTDVCADPNGWLAALADGYHAATGTSIEIRSRVEDRLEPRTSSSVAPADRERLAAALQTFAGPSAQASGRAVVAEEGLEPPTPGL